MPELKIYRWMSTIFGASYRLKIMIMAFLGTHVPLIAIVVFFVALSTGDWSEVLSVFLVVLVATLIGTAFTLLILNELLRPVLMTSAALRAYRTTGAIRPLPSEFSDEVGTLMADAGATITHMHSLIDVLQHVDETTGLPNRARFLERLESRLQRGEALGIAVVRLTDFPRIARALGLAGAHSAAKTIAARLAKVEGVEPTLARVGNFDFAFVLPQTRRGDATVVGWSALLMQEIDVLSGDIDVADTIVRPEIRFGLASSPEDATDALELLEHATTAAAQATEAVPVAVYSAQAREDMIDRFKIEQELRLALQREEFELHYQPMVDVEAGTLVGCEALIRWRHPERGLIPPGLFLPAAEQSGLIEEMGAWVIKEACRQMRDWIDRGIAAPRVSINISARQFSDEGLQTLVADALAASRVPPSLLEIELTETTAIADDDRTLAVFAVLRALGVRIALDDFGSGYASMSYLRKLPVDKIKIDREFVSHVESNRTSKAICGAIIALAKGLGVEILAEGVERPQEVDFLRSAGCPVFQGYYFARPMPVAEFERAIPELTRSLAMAQAAE